jgi:hypothetical protein
MPANSELTWLVNALSPRAAGHPDGRAAKG